jgi:hypothetical protein
MPRPRNPTNEEHRRRTERWRDRRRIAGRPEASIIDRAIAASFAAFLTASLYGDEEDRLTLRDIVMGAQRLLVDQGFDKRQSNAELMRRMTRRSDLMKVSEVAGADHKAL